MKSHSNQKNVEGMSKFGINPKNTLGVSIPILRKMAKEIGKDHGLAQMLWASGVHEAKILAGMIDNPAAVTEKQVDKWSRNFDSWDTCDQVCMNLFGKTKFAYQKVWDLAKNDKEFVRRAAFALIAVLAWQDKTENRDRELTKFFPLIKKYSTDERNFVKKAVNWALRNIGKRNSHLRKAAIKTAEEIQKIDSKSAKWIASDAIRELKHK